MSITSRTLVLSLTVSLCLSAASVKRFGAKGDGITDDTAAIQRAIRATRSGTLVFPKGTYLLSSTLTLEPNVTYKGEGQAILKGNGYFWLMQMPRMTMNLTITGLTFDNGGLLLQGQVLGARIIDNTFQNLTADNTKGNWTLGNAIFSPDGVHNVKISGNTFKNILIGGVTRPDGTWNSIDKFNTAMRFYGLDKTSIDHNTFDKVGQGISICFTNSWPSHDVYIGYNTFTRVHRMGMEIQGAIGCGRAKPVIDGPDTYDLTIEYNSLTDWDDPYWWSFPISLANPAPYGGSGAIIRYNYIVGGKTAYWDKEGPKGKYGYGIEAASAGLQVYGNTVKGYWGMAISVADSPNAHIHDNFTCGLAQGATMTIGAQSKPSPGAVYEKNKIISHSCPATMPNPVAELAKRK
ncbi:MAG TPA: glycosyl hydrolase family 28-related protein [Bryobacteraceae bacterium]